MPDDEERPWTIRNMDPVARSAAVAAADAAHKTVAEWLSAAIHSHLAQDNRREMSDGMIEALQRIADWSGAYSTRFFPAPDVEEWQRARELLAAAGISLDRLAADCMRHVAEGMGKIAYEALRNA